MHSSEFTTSAPHRTAPQPPMWKQKKNGKKREKKPHIINFQVHRTNAPSPQQPGRLFDFFLPSISIYSSTLLTRSHSPFNVSFHNVTLLSPPLTASTFPLRLQLTRHTTVSRGMTLRAHGDCASWSRVQMMTLLSCDADAM